MMTNALEQSIAAADASFSPVINNMQDYVQRTARTSPHQTALVISQKSVSYSELDQQISQLAAYFQQHQVQRGDRIVCCAGNGLVAVLSFWAALRAGAVISLVANDIEREKLNYILCDSAATLLVVDGMNLDHDAYQQLLSDTPVSHLLTTDSDTTASCADIGLLEQALTQQSTVADNQTLDIDLAAIIYTSGSTGEPKGVMLTHRNMITATESLNQYLGYRASDRVLNVLPLSFDYGLYQMIMAFSVGATLVLERDFAWPLMTIKKIQQMAITVFPIVPTIVTLLEQCVDKFKLDLSSVRLVSNTGAEVNQYHLDIIARRFANAKMYSMYGLTECKRCSYLSPDDLLRKPGSVGVAIPNTEIFIVDDNGKPLGANQVGEIAIRGGTVMKGYWRKPEKTAEKLKDGPLPGEKILHTGDLGLKDEEGYLYFRGRKDDVLKCRGEKVSPREVEAFLMALEGIKESAIVGVADTKVGHKLLAFVAIEDGSVLTADHIETHCQTLKPNQRPEQIELIPALPKTTNGKVDKKALRVQAQQLLQEAI